MLRLLVTGMASPWPISFILFTGFFDHVLSSPDTMPILYNLLPFTLDIIFLSCLAPRLRCRSLLRALVYEFIRYFRCRIPLYIIDSFYLLSVSRLLNVASLLLYNVCNCTTSPQPHLADLLLSPLQLVTPRPYFIP